MAMQKAEQCDLFNMFHDGSFSMFQRKNDDIAFQIDIQYLAERIDPTYTYFNGILSDCQYCMFESLENDQMRYKDVDLINTILEDMGIGQAKCESERISLFFCGWKNAGGSLTFVCNDILLFDQGGKAVTIGELQEICHQYWQDFKMRRR